MLLLYGWVTKLLPVLYNLSRSLNFHSPALEGSQFWCRDILKLTANQNRLDVLEFSFYLKLLNYPFLSVIAALKCRHALAPVSLPVKQVSEGPLCLR